MESRIDPRKILAARVFPHFSRTLEKFNSNARWMETVRSARNIPLFHSRNDLHAFVHGEVSGIGPIDYMEFGVWRGESLRFWTQREKNPGSRFFGFDSFEGLPEDWSDNYTKGHFSTGGKLPDIADDRVEFIVGWFQNTVRDFILGFQERDSPLVVHCDADLYSSTLFCLASLDRIVRPGTILIFDEFDAMLHEYRALVDWANAFVRTWNIVGATDTFRQVAVRVLS